MKNKGYLYALLGGAFWGFSGTCGKYVFLNSSLDATSTTCIRLFIGGLLLSLYSLVFHKDAFKQLIQDKKDLIHLIIFSIFGLLFLQLSFFITIELSNSGTATILQYTGIILIMLVTCFIEKHLPYRKDVLAMVFVLFGVFFISTHGSLSSLVLSPTVLIWGAISAITNMSYTLLPRNLLKKYGPVNVLGWAMFVAGFVLSILVQPWKLSFTYTNASMIALLVNILFGGILAFTFYFMGVEKIGGMKASMLACLEPVVATISTAIWLHTVFTIQDILGFVCITLGVLLVNYQKSIIQ